MNSVLFRIKTKENHVILLNGRCLDSGHPILCTTSHDYRHHHGGRKRVTRRFRNARSSHYCCSDEREAKTIWRVFEKKGYHPQPEGGFIFRSLTLCTSPSPADTGCPVVLRFGQGLPHAPPSGTTMSRPRLRTIIIRFAYTRRGRHFVDLHSPAHSRSANLVRKSRPTACRSDVSEKISRASNRKRYAFVRATTRCIVRGLPRRPVRYE